MRTCRAAFADLVVDDEFAVEEPVGVKKGVLVRLGVGDSKGMEGGCTYSMRLIVLYLLGVCWGIRPNISSTSYAPETDGIWDRRHSPSIATERRGKLRLTLAQGLELHKAVLFPRLHIKSYL